MARKVDKGIKKFKTSYSRLGDTITEIMRKVVDENCGHEKYDRNFKISDDLSTEVSSEIGDLVRYKIAEYQEDIRTFAEITKTLETLYKLMAMSDYYDKLKDHPTDCTFADINIRLHLPVDINLATMLFKWIENDEHILANQFDVAIAVVQQQVNEGSVASSAVRKDITKEFAKDNNLPCEEEDGTAFITTSRFEDDLLSLYLNDSDDDDDDYDDD